MMATLYTHINYCSFGPDSDSLVVCVFYDRDGTDITEEVKPTVGDELRIYQLSPTRENARHHLITAVNFIGNFRWELRFETPDLDLSTFWNTVRAKQNTNANN